VVGRDLLELTTMANASERINFTWVRTGLRLMLFALAGLGLFTGPAGAEPINRRVLAIYDSTFEATPDSTLVHSKTEMPLNHLGYVVDYRDAAKALPDLESAAGYAAVITWFTYDVSRPSEYMAWARRLAERGVPFIIFGQVGAPATPQYLRSINSLLEPMGIAYTSNFVEATNGTQVLGADPAAIGFERRLKDGLPSYPVIRRLSAESGVLLEVQAPPRERLVHSALVTAGPRGAFVVSGFALYVDPALGRTEWIVDPFTILRRVLGSAPFPIPDTTTVSGRRLYFSHVDGDGWNDDVSIDHYRNPAAIAAEVMAKELIEPYPDLPVTVGLIASDLDPAFGDGERAAAAARHIFSLPQVEVASHSATSPLVWSFYENYSRDEEEKLMGATPTPNASTGWLGTVAGAFGLVQEPSDIERNRSLYLSGSRGLPRAYVRDPFSLQTEVQGAVDKTNELAPEGKRAAIYSWTGDAEPFEAAVQATRQAGLRNINGGGARVDPSYASISYVTPIARQVGTERQIYAVDASDASFTSAGESGIAGFSALKSTLDATESPVRLKGVDLYYHAFAAKGAASLKVVRGFLDWARGADLAPITASQYAAIADGFFSTQLEQTGPSSWLVSDRDGLQTVRFDGSVRQFVDIRDSVGVVGSRMYQGSLYVALDASVPAVRISMRSELPIENAQAAASIAQLEEANWMVRDVQRGAGRLTYSALGFGTAQFSWKDLARGNYHVEASRGAEVVWQTDVNVGLDGVLEIQLPTAEGGQLDFAVRCAQPTSEKSS
jgi:hypothetical protein